MCLCVRACVCVRCLVLECLSALSFFFFKLCVCLCVYFLKVIDVDALPPPVTGTASTWVWHGASVLDQGPISKWDRALVSLSPGGSDADTMREFDLVAKKFLDPDTEKVGEENKKTSKQLGSSS